jgi:L-ascorbate metabolism protein UlaG (beta-lactamase superfamily)
VRSGMTIVTRILIAGLNATFAFPPAASAQAGDQATVWYLRHTAWAVRLGDALLVFDYQESMGMEDVAADAPHNLAHGFIDPAEIADLDVFVFVTHAHGDHYDPVIFEWQDKIPHLTYFIGWDEQPTSHCERFVRAGADCHTMGGLRATAEADGLQVYTIDSHHNGIPEVAYLVRSGDWTVYHNGDYMADYVADYAYLKAVTDRIDLAFVAGIGNRRWPHLARAVHLAREFAVPVLFPMHFRDREMCEGFVAEVAADGVTAAVECPTAPGQRFTVAKGGTTTGR